MTIVAPKDQDARDRIHRDLGSSLFVEAGAGTGKTHELVERVLHLVASGQAEMRGIAAITFTEAAAAELRDRVRIGLEGASRDDGRPAEERERCSQAVDELDAAAIETLHGFAQRILSAHPLEAGLPPLIEIQDEIRSSIEFEERWSEFVDEMLDRPELEAPLLRAFLLGMNPADLREVAAAFHAHWDRLEECPIEETPPSRIDAGLVLKALEGACELLPQCVDPEDGLCKHLERLNGYRRRLESARSETEQLRVLGEQTRIYRGRMGRKDNWQGVTVDEVRDRLRHAHDLRDTLLDSVRTDALGPIVSALRGFVLEYAAERRRQGRLEFQDLLVLAKNLLRNNAEARRAARSSYTHLLIDEFQDTDPLQIDIAVLLASDDGGGRSWRETPTEPGRLFFVGDPKQSIYRFRRADIALYLEAQQQFSKETTRLTQNFRSVPAVLDWVNHVFEALMGGDGDRQEGQATYVPLHAARTGHPDAGVTVRVLGGPHAENIGPIREREAREIARTIQAAKAEGWPVVERSADGEERTRTARYQDIAILFPTRTALPPLEQALEEAGIPYRVESRSLVYDSQEVRDLLAILRAIDDPVDEVALVAALRSPAFGCGDDDLLRYAQAGGGWDYRRGRPEALGEDDPVVEAMTALHALHKRRWWESISGVVEAVIRERRLLELAFGKRRPRERWQRLRFLVDQARAFEEAGGRTLRQFVDWAERQAKEGTRVVETIVPERDDDAVRIMTIHAAKGLEFPIAVLAGLNVSGARAHKRCVVWHKDGRPEVQVGSKTKGFRTPGYEDVAAHEELMERQEKIRLLYVAATRARDHLVVSLHHKEGRDSHAKRLYERCGEATHLWRPVELDGVRDGQEGARKAAAFDDSPERRQAWLDGRSERIEALSRAPRWSATEIARRAAGGEADPNVEKDPPVEETPPWRRGRAGTAVGRAVHAVLQSIDLETGSGLEGAAQAQAAAEGIADRAGEVARMVRAALEAPSVREAVASGGRYWRELFVSAAVDGVTVEGFVDLLYESPGGLVVVDYKTDTIPSEGELDAAIARYRLQGAAYALALEEALGREVAKCVFVFARPGGARERAIEDLAAAVAEVRTAVAQS